LSRAYQSDSTFVAPPRAALRPAPEKKQGREGRWPVVVGKMPKGLEIRTSTPSGNYDVRETKGLFVLINEALGVLESSCYLNPADALPAPGTKLNPQDPKIPLTAHRIGSSWHFENHVVDALAQVQKEEKEQREYQAKLAAKAER